MDIWSLEIGRFIQAEKDAIESVEYLDKGGSLWRVHRTDSGIFFGFFGDHFKKVPTFRIYTEAEIKQENYYISGEIEINNTGLFFVKVTDFETFAKIREVILQNTTSKIWRTISKLFEERLMFDNTLLKCEVHKIE